MQDRFNDPAAARLFYSLDMLKEFVPYLRRHHWGPSGEITSFVRLQRTGHSPQLEGQHALSQACLGRIDEARRSGLTSVFVRGWAFNRFDRQPGDRIALVADTGKIVGYAELNQVRPDVAAQYPEAQNLRPGWKTNITVPSNGIYHVFLCSEKTQSACPLQNELRIQNRPSF